MTNWNARIRPRNERDPFFAYEAYLLPGAVPLQDTVLLLSPKQFHACTSIGWELDEDYTLSTRHKDITHKIRTLVTIPRNNFCITM